jgi:AcrR family transcriptional regulator
MDTTILANAGRKPRGEGQARRGEILSAAKRIFLSDGYANATIRKIAAAVGVSSGALYLYFPDKDAILRGIAEDTFAALVQCLEDAKLGHACPLQRLRAGMRAYIDFGRARPDEYRLTFLSKMMSEATPGRTSTAVCDRIQDAERSFDILLQETRNLIETGLFRPADPEEIAEALWSCMHGVTAILLDHPNHITTGADRLADTVVDIAINGMRRLPA